VLVRTTAGELSLVAADGSGTRRPLASNIKSSRFDSSASTVLAITKTGALQRIPLSGGAAPITLVAAGVGAPRQPIAHDNCDLLEGGGPTTFSTT